MEREMELRLQKIRDRDAGQAPPESPGGPPSVTTTVTPPDFTAPAPAASTVPGDFGVSGAAPTSYGPPAAAPAPPVQKTAPAPPVQKTAPAPPVRQVFKAAPACVRAPPPTGAAQSDPGALHVCPCCPSVTSVPSIKLSHPLLPPWSQPFRVQVSRVQLGVYKGVTYQLVPENQLLTPMYTPMFGEMTMTDFILESPAWMQDSFIRFMELTGLETEEPVATVLELDPAVVALVYSGQVALMANRGSRIFASALHWCGKPPVDFRKKARQVRSTGSSGCSGGFPGSAGCFVCNIGGPVCFVFGVGGQVWQRGCCLVSDRCVGRVLGFPLRLVSDRCWTRGARTLAGMDFGGHGLSRGIPGCVGQCLIVLDRVGL